MTCAAWCSRLSLAALLGLGGCRDYGSIASLATPDVRLSPEEFLGTWRAPDALRCRRQDQFDGARFALPFHVFRVDTTLEGQLRMVGVPDPTCEVPADDTVEYRGTLLRLGDRRFLEIRAEAPVPFATVPLFQWLRLGVRGDTVLLEPLWADSLGAWLARAPGVTPHRVSEAQRDQRGQGTIVLTGDPTKLKAFVRKAFANPAMRFSDTLVFVRDRPDLRGPPRS